MRDTKINHQTRIYPCANTIGISKFKKNRPKGIFRHETIYLSKKEAVEIAKWILKNINKKY